MTTKYGITSQPVSFPTEVRATRGQITPPTSYTTAGTAPSVSDWGGGSNGIPNRVPDFVIFGTSLAAGDDTATDQTLIYNYNPSNGLVQIFGDTVTEAGGLDEIDSTSDAHTAPVNYIALWFGADAAGTTTVAAA